MTWHIITLKTQPPKFMPKLSETPQSIFQALGPTFATREDALRWIERQSPDGKPHWIIFTKLMDPMLYEARLQQQTSPLFKSKQECEQWVERQKNESKDHNSLHSD